MNNLIAPFFEGVILQSSLIIALGAQNLFVLECGLRKQNPILVASLCTLCDALLIALGVLGAATLFLSYPLIKIIFGILGVAFLVYYGVLKLRESFFSFKETYSKPVPSKKKIIIQTLAFSLLNPHVYLDTIILIGGYSTQFPDLMDRSLFGAGAASISFLWFFGLSLLSSQLSRFLSRPRAMRGIALVSGLLLTGLSFKLGKDVLEWITQSL